MFFVAYNLAKLAEETLNCTSEVLDMRDSESKGSLLRHLANSHPVLVPYPFCRHHCLIPTCLVIILLMKYMQSIREFFLFRNVCGGGGGLSERKLCLLGLKCTCKSTQVVCALCHYIIFRIAKKIIQIKSNQMIMDCMMLYDLCIGLLFVINWQKDMMEMGIMPHVWRMATKPTGLFWQVLLTLQMICKWSTLCRLNYL